MKYRFYPTLLNAFSKYLQDGNKEILLNRINRVADFDDATLTKFRRGIRFENAVLLGVPHQFDTKIVTEAQDLLPIRKNIQQKVSFNYKNAQIYGIADVVGDKKVIDIKTTSHYYPEKYKDNFQNLYLYALQKYDYQEMQYIIYDFEKLYIESYSLADINLDKMFEEIELFTIFLEENQHLITDKKIIIKSTGLSLFD